MDDSSRVIIPEEREKKSRQVFRSKVIRSKVEESVKSIKSIKPTQNGGYSSQKEMCIFSFSVLRSKLYVIHSQRVTVFPGCGGDPQPRI